jgi:hypothetical protein
MHKIRNFHEGHSTVGEWQDSGRVVAGKRHGMCESAFKTAGERHGNSMGTAWYVSIVLNTIFLTSALGVGV